MCDTLFYVGDQEYKPANIIDIFATLCNNIKRKVNKRLVSIFITPLHLTVLGLHTGNIRFLV